MRVKKHNDTLAAAKAVSYLLILLGVIILIPLLCLFFYPEEMDQAYAFVFPGVISILVGYIFKVFTAPYSVTTLKKYGGSSVVLFIWILSIVVGAIPFYLSKDYTITQALFESSSGFTTAGFTVTNVDSATHMILLYRAILQLVGGVGLVLIMATLFSNLYGMQMFSAEGHTDRLAPSPLSSARTIMIIYLSFIIGGTVAYTIFGMPTFDALCHAISSVATGGFSTKSQSLGYWHSVPIDIITIVLMVLGGTNFMASMFALRGKWKNFLFNSETIMTLSLLGVAIPIVTAELLKTKICVSLPSAVDNAVFQVVSIITTTGLTTVDNFLVRCGSALFPVMILMIVGGHSDSTACGIKASRAALACKSIYWDVRANLFNAREVRAREITRFGKKETVTRDMQTQNYTYIFMYLILIFCGSYALSLCGYTFTDSLVEFTSALGTIGMSVGIVSRDMGNAPMWIMMFGMLISRLEIYIFIFALARGKGDLEERKNEFTAFLKKRKGRMKHD